MWQLTYLVFSKESVVFPGCPRSRILFATGHKNKCWRMTLRDNICGRKTLEGLSFFIVSISSCHLMCISPATCNSSPDMSPDKLGFPADTPISVFCWGLEHVEENEMICHLTWEIWWWPLPGRRWWRRCIRARCRRPLWACNIATALRVRLRPLSCSPHTSLLHHKSTRSK